MTHVVTTNKNVMAKSSHVKRNALKVSLAVIILIAMIFSVMAVAFAASISKVPVGSELGGLGTLTQNSSNGSASSLQGLGKPNVSLPDDLDTLGDKTENYEGEIKDVNGNLLVPFDVAYPEEFNGGNHEYRKDALLLKMGSDFGGELTESLSKCGFVSLDVSVKTANGTWYEAKIAEGEDITAVMQRVRELDEVIMADYDYVIKAADMDVQAEGSDGSLDGINGKVLGNGQVKNQWYLKYSGIQDAWKELEKKGLEPGGLPSVVVAVIDTGVDYTHPDLKNNIWVNMGEIPDNGRDDDGNGYVDDYYGYNAVANKGSGMDVHGHGTHVAGIIAASNNKEGVVGIAYNAKIMPITAGQATGIFTQNDIAEAIIYAYEMGADVINMSFGGSACSIAVQDALMTAYTRSTLVASAGNDGYPNEGSDYFVPLPNYPGALSYVIGVMSVNQQGVESGFTNWDTKAFNSIEYEVYAPGEQIYSTLAGGGYGNLSGTSMAAPVVSGIAALLRSYFSDRDMYPSKFIQAQICATSEDEAFCCDPQKHTVGGFLHNLPMITNAHDALTKLPKPDVNVFDYYIFDGEELSDKNNGDGIADAGETIDIAIVLRNRWGMSENTVVTIDALSDLGVANPYVEILIDSENYDSVGTYSTKSMLVYDEDNFITGYTLPLRVKISEDCPNDYRIGLNATLTFGNALDEKDKTIYENKGGISFDVRSGVILPSQITENMTLTKENLYIIPNSAYIAKGVTVTVEPGTRIQFWSDDPGDVYSQTAIAYLNVEGSFITKGTVDEPVEIFPSDLMATYWVRIYTTGYGRVDLSYTTVTNPYLDINTADHCTFRQNYTRLLNYRYLSDGKVVTNGTTAYIQATEVTNSMIYKFGSAGSAQKDAYWYSTTSLSGKYDTCAFVDSKVNLTNARCSNCVFMGNTAMNEGGGMGTSSLVLEDRTRPTISRIVKDRLTGTTYVKIYGNLGNSNVGLFEASRALAKEMGGDLVCIESEEEREFLKSSGMEGMVGLIRGSDTWINGEAIPDGLVFDYGNCYAAVYDNTSVNNDIPGGSCTFLNSYFILVEIPGSIYCDTILLDEPKAEIDMESSYQLAPTVIPATFDANELIYVSEDPAIATVDKNGLVTPVAKGETRIFVYSPDYKAYAVMSLNIVEKVELEEITFAVTSETVQKGSSFTLKPIFTPANTTERIISFSSSDESVLKVDKFGRVTAEGVGTATITVEGANGLKATYTAKVITPVESISFTDKFYVTFVGDTDTEWEPVVLPADSSDYTLTYISSNPETAYVDEDGELVRVAPGNATIRAMIEGTELYADLSVTVSDTDEFVSSKVVEMAYYNGFVFAVTEDDSLWMWGGGYLRLPVKVADGIKDVIVHSGGSGSAGNSSYRYCDAYVLKTDGTVERGNIYYETNDYERYPVGFSANADQSKFEHLTDIVKLERYDTSCYALRADGTVWAWGYNSYGQLGDGTTTDRSVAIQMNINNVKKAVPFYGSVLLLTNDGKSYLFGGTSRIYTEAQLIAENAVDIRGGYGGIVELAGGSQMTIENSGNVQNISYSSSERKYYSYSTNTFYIQNENVKWNNGVTYCPGIEEILYISGSNLFYYRTEDGKIYGVGINDSFQLANLSTTSSEVPVRIFLGLGSSDKGPEVEGVNISEDRLLDDTLVLDFDKAVIAGNEYGYIKLKDSQGNTLSINKKIVLDKMSFAPVAGFVHGETYTLTVPAGALLDMYGNDAGAIAYTFTYVNTAPIEETGASISDGAVLSETDIELSFGYSVANKGEFFENIAITSGGNTVSGITAKLENNVLTLSGTLDYGDYILTIPTGALCDNVGGENEKTVISFSVVRTLKHTASSVNDGEERASESDNITLTFEGALKGDGFDEITLKTLDGEAVEIAVELVGGVLTVSHGGLMQGRAYVLTVPAGALVDAIGTANEEIVVGFTTYAPAAIDRASLEAGSSDVALDPVFRFIYNGEFTPDASKLTLTAQNGDVVALNVAVSGKTFTVTPAVTLEPDTAYTLALGEGLMTDERGALSASVSYTFDTVKVTERFFWTDELVGEKIDEWIKGGYNNPGFIGNAILNNYQDTNVEHWLRVTAGNYVASESYMKSIGLAGNWWGTTKEELVGLQVLDFDDFQALADINYKNYLTKAPENTFPFVTQAYLLNKDGERVDRVSNETVTFVVEFNRDMDTTVPLRVRFGSSLPYAEYEIEGEYVTPRRWEGTYTLKTTIENGRQRICIENGRAADDHYLQLFETDTCRFGFEIDTAGAQAMMMQAVATETGIELSWMQDDFDTIAGYNVYRSTAEDGLYVRLNDFVLPADVTTFFDADVLPGVRYYYNFTVVKTDFSESAPSGKINLVSMDTEAPGIYHSSVRTAFTGSNLVVRATVTDNLLIREARLFYRTVGETEWKSVAMTNLNSSYSAVIPSEHISVEGLEYYIVAFDGINYTNKGSDADPYKVTVQLAVDASAKGDVDGDGVITGKDALMLLQAINDLINLTPEQFLRADIDGDGILSAAEALRILHYVSGKITVITW